MLYTYTTLQYIHKKNLILYYSVPYNACTCNRQQASVGLRDYFQDNRWWFPLAIPSYRCHYSRTKYGNLYTCYSHLIDGLFGISRFHFYWNMYVASISSFKHHLESHRTFILPYLSLSASIFSHPHPHLSFLDYFTPSPSTSPSFFTRSLNRSNIPFFLQHLPMSSFLSLHH